MHTMEYYSAIKNNTFESILMRRMKLESIIQSEVSQKEKYQCSMLTHIYIEFRNMVTMTLYARQQKKYRCKEQSFGLWEKVGWFARVCWTNYIIICEADPRSSFDAWGKVIRAGVLGWPCWWDGEGGEKGVLNGEHMYARGWFMLMYGKPTIMFKSN